MILTVSQLEIIRPYLEGTVVATNGCFDILHAGHVNFLEACKRKGDTLVVGLNGDASVKALKGEGRPINPEHLRAKLLVALKAVDIVCIFEGVRCADFLLFCEPDVYVKGGDYTLNTLDSSERAALNPKTRIEFVPLTEGVSTTETIRKVLCEKPTH